MPGVLKQGISKFSGTNVTFGQIMDLGDEALLIWTESCGGKIETDSTAKKLREINDTRKNK